MKYTKIGDTVKIHFTCKLDDDSIFDTSVGREPLQITIGEGNVIAGLEEALIGMLLGESKTIQIPPEKAFGPYRKEKVMVMSREEFPNNIQIEVGLQMRSQLADGEENLLTVIDVSATSVTLNANHPLAGKKLIFNIQLIDISQLDSGSAITYINLGNSAAEKRQFDNAIAYYQQALQINPHNETAYYNIGKILLSFNIEGWITVREASCLYLLSTQVENLNPVIVEIGSYMGLSSMIFAKGLKEKLSGKVYCIDPWESTVPSLTDDMKAAARNLEEQGLSLYNIFLKNMKLAGVSSHIVTTRGYSLDIIKKWSKAIDILFIDADHSYEATLSDFNNWIHFLKPGGIVVLHDVELPSISAKFYAGPGRVVEERILQSPAFEEGVLIDSLFYARKR